MKLVWGATIRHRLPKRAPHDARRRHGLTPHPPTARTVAVEAQPLLPQFVSDAVELVAGRKVIAAAAGRFKDFPLSDQGGDATRLTLVRTSVPGNSGDGARDKK
jgi:hypothetical protein